MIRRPLAVAVLCAVLATACGQDIAQRIESLYEREKSGDLTVEQLEVDEGGHVDALRHLEVVAEDIEVREDGRIDVTGRGHAGGYRYGSRSDKRGLGLDDQPSSGRYAGGSHGGEGAHPSAGATYGEYLSHLLPGAGGGGGARTSTGGGNGGGTMRLTAGLVAKSRR